MWCGMSAEHGGSYDYSFSAEPEPEQRPSSAPRRLAAQPTFEDDVGGSQRNSTVQKFPEGSPMQRLSQSHTPASLEFSPGSAAPGPFPLGISAEEEAMQLGALQEQVEAANARMADEIARKDSLLLRLAGMEDAALDTHSSNAEIMAHNARLQAEVKELQLQIQDAKEDSELIVPKQTELKELLQRQREANDALLDEMTDLENENVEWDTKLQALEAQKDEEHRANMALLADLAKLKANTSVPDGGGGVDGIQQQIFALQQQNDGLLQVMDLSALGQHPVFARALLLLAHPPLFAHFSLCACCAGADSSAGQCEPTLRHTQRSRSVPAWTLFTVVPSAVPRCSIGIDTGPATADEMVAGNQELEQVNEQVASSAPSFMSWPVFEFGCQGASRTAVCLARVQLLDQLEQIHRENDRLAAELQGLQQGHGVVQQHGNGFGQGAPQPQNRRVSSQHAAAAAANRFIA